MSAPRFALRGLAIAASAALATSPLHAQTVVPLSGDLITRGDAMRAVEAALAECKTRGEPATAIVVDAQGWQRVQLSDDKAMSIGISTSAQKAASVLAFKASTAELAARAASDKAFADQYGKDSRYHFSPGGFPLYRDGKFVAVLAVGGARNFDTECARAGVKALPWAAITPPGK